MNQLDLGLAGAVKPQFPAGPIVRSAKIEGNYRWEMRRAWGAGPCIHWNLLNPSEANAQQDDPTTRRMMGFSFRWGFGSMVVTNVYPFITPNPAALAVWRKRLHAAREDDRGVRDAWFSNMEVVCRIVRSVDTHVAAWGAGADEDDVREFLSEISWVPDVFGTVVQRRNVDDCGGHRAPIEWKCIGITAGGFPIHPLARGVYRVPDDAVLQPWRAA